MHKEADVDEQGSKIQYGKRRIAKGKAKGGRRMQDAK
jgi:hypothetical protein